MMLDPKRTFDELIERLAPDPPRAEEIKANRVYRELSTAVSGSQEFTAISKLYELDQRGRLRPARARHAAVAQRARLPRRPRAADLVPRGPRAEGVHAPDRARDAGSRPRQRARCSAACGGSPASTCSRDLSTFFQLLGDMTEDFSERAAEVEQMLRARHDRVPARHLGAARADRRGDLVPPHARRERASVRREWSSTASTTTSSAHSDPSEVAQRWRTSSAPSWPRAWRENFHDYHVLARRDEQNIARLETELDGPPAAARAPPRR